MNEYPDPNFELREAANRLATAAGSRADSPSHDARINDALIAMRTGDVKAGYMSLEDLANEGVPYAPHFLGWLHRYRAEIALRQAAEFLARAIELGYAQSARHLEQVETALQVIGYPKPVEPAD